eukprot:scaffold10511_cov129-Isochrysis_galbana.AAC.4
MGPGLRWSRPAHSPIEPPELAWQNWYRPSKTGQSSPTLTDGRRGRKWSGTTVERELQRKAQALKTLAARSWSVWAVST